LFMHLKTWMQRGFSNGWWRNPMIG